MCSIKHPSKPQTTGKQRSYLSATVQLLCLQQLPLLPYQEVCCPYLFFFSNYDTTLHLLPPRLALNAATPNTGHKRYVVRTLPCFFSFLTNDLVQWPHLMSAPSIAQSPVLASLLHSVTSSMTTNICASVWLCYSALYTGVLTVSACNTTNLLVWILESLSLFCPCTISLLFVPAHTPFCTHLKPFSLSCPCPTISFFHLCPMHHSIGLGPAMQCSGPYWQVQQGAFLLGPRDAQVVYHISRSYTSLILGRVRQVTLPIQHSRASARIFFTMEQNTMSALALCSLRNSPKSLSVPSLWQQQP